MTSFRAILVQECEVLVPFFISYPVLPQPGYSFAFPVVFYKSAGNRSRNLRVPLRDDSQ